MLSDLKRLLGDERGSSFLENALWLILFTLTIAAFVASLASVTGEKISELTNRVGEVGTP